MKKISEKYKFQTEIIQDKILELLFLEGKQIPKLLEEKIKCAHGTLFENLKKLTRTGLIRAEKGKYNDSMGRVRNLDFYLLTNEGYRYISNKLGHSEYENIIFRMKFREKLQFVHDFSKKYEVEEQLIPDLINTYLHVELNEQFHHNKTDLCIALYFLKKNSIQNYPTYLAQKELYLKFKINPESLQAKRIDYFITVLKDQFEFDEILIDDGKFYLDLNDELGKLIFIIVNKAIVNEIIIGEVNTHHNFTEQEILFKTLSRLEKYSVINPDIIKLANFQNFLEKVIKKVTIQTPREIEAEPHKIFDFNLLEPRQRVISSYFQPEKEKAKGMLAVLSTEIRLPEEILFEELYNIIFHSLEDLGIEDIQSELDNALEKLENEPDNMQIIQKVSILLYKKKEYTKALEQISKIDTAGLSPNSQLEIFLFRAEIYIRLKEYQKSIKLLKQALKFELKQFTIWNRIGALYLNLQQWDNAVNALKKAISIKEDEKVFVHIAMASYSKKDFNNALFYFDKYLETNPKRIGDPEVFKSKKAPLLIFTSAMSASVKIKNYTKALDYFKLAVEQFPREGSFWDYGGEIYSKMKRYDDAIKCYNRAEELFMNFKSVIRDSSKQSQKNEIRLELISRIIKLNIKRKAWTDALENIERAFKIDKDNPFFWMEKGHIFILKKEEVKASECFLKAIQLLHRNYPADSKENAKFLTQKGHILLASGKIEEAKHSYHKALKIEPNKSYTWMILGHIAYSEGNNEDALKYFKEALKIDPENEKVQQSIKYISDVLMEANEDLEKQQTETQNQVNLKDRSSVEPKIVKKSKKYTKEDWEKEMTDFFTKFVSRSDIKYLATVLEHESPVFQLKQASRGWSHDWLKMQLERVEDQDTVNYYLEQFKWGFSKFDQLYLMIFLEKFLDNSDKGNED